MPEKTHQQVVNRTAPAARRRRPSHHRSQDRTVRRILNGPLSEGTRPVMTSVATPEVGAANSRHEQEAERLARRVEPAMPTPETATVHGPAPAANDATDHPDRESGSGESDSEENATETRESLLAGGLWQKVKSLFTGGRPLPEQTAERYQQALGYDFRGTRIHTGPGAVQLTRSLGAQAITYRNHILFNERAYQPDTAPGRHRLAHELTHVAQQGGAVPSPSSEATVSVQPARPQLQGDWDLGVGDALSNAGNAVLDAGGDAVNYVGDRANDVIEAGADAIWAVVRRVAPDAFMDLVDEIREKGFFGYLKDKIADVTGSILEGLGDKSPILSSMVTRFAGFATTMVEITQGLAQGNCEPLFAALRQLKDMVASLARDAWDGITDFFKPIGDFFADVWVRFGAPVLDWLKEVASDTWDYIKSLGQQIWDWTRPVVDAIRSMVGDAWDWIKDKLGMGGSGNSEGGLIDWVKDKAASAWSAIKTELQPVIRPIQDVVDKVKEVLPLEAITNFRETVNGWLQEVASTAQAMDQGEGGDVAENQASLRDRILPAILNRIQAFQGTLTTTGQWVSVKIGGIVDTGQTFLTKLSTAPIISGMRSAFDWLSTALGSVKTWAQDTVQSLFTAIGNGLVKLSRFIEPVLNALKKIVGVLGNLLKRLPDFLLGPIWWVLPDCIKNPIKNFFIEQILSRIPLFQQLTAVGDIWARIQAMALRVLEQIFVDGNLMGALWTFFRRMLNLIGIPAQLVVRIVANAAQAFSDILMDPIGFLGNMLRAMKEGASQFFGNIFTHLFNGISGWLFGQIEEAGLTPPDITSFRSILSFVFDLLGLTMENIWNRLAEHVGRPVVERIRGAIDMMQGAWEWIKVAVTEGLTGLWDMIRERISDLWNTVLDAVVSWVNTAIISTASRWLLSLLDVSGITPIINALIAIYRAIESFAQYMAEMLEIIASVTRGIADLAKGKLAAAVDFLVGALSNSIPIVVGFLANQFGLGRLGERISELVEGIRGRINSALDWIIETALRVGSGFIDMLRSGAELVRNWWEQRKSFQDEAGEEHELYFEGERGDLIIASTPQPIGAFLNQLQIPEDDPQHAQKEGHKTDAERIYRDITQLRQTMRTRERAGEDISDERQQLNTLFDQLAVHLTPLMVGTEETAGGRVPTPLTLQALDGDPVPMPRTSDEEQVDLDAGRQLVMLVQEHVDDSDAMADYFDRIKRRLALDEVGFVEQNDRFEVRLRAGNELRVSVSENLKGDTPGLNLTNEISYRTGSAAGDTVGVDMEADNLGPSHGEGSGPGNSALSGVMDHLVTDPGNRNPSKYIKGHLLNDNIGGPGSSENLYPITAEANRSHETNVESIVKRWVNNEHYWVYYRVQVRNVSEHIEHPGRKDPDNWINAQFHCQAYIKKTDGGQANAFTETIVSRYEQDPAEDHRNPNALSPEEREARANTEGLNDEDVVGGGQYEGDVLESSRNSDRTYQLDSRLKQALDGVASENRTEADIQEAVDAYNDSGTQSLALGPARISTLLTAYQRYNEGNLTGLSQAEKASLTYMNERAGQVRAVLTNADESVPAA
ncbi:eCIS core domain-containing protein [Saccharospirillum salsuginis]|nr:DUF4157 domain-containing protein [Saccharospirillum salsuginis]